MTRSPGFWLAAAACVIVIAAVVAGLFVIEGPGTARLERLDEARLDDLRRILRAAEQTEHDGEGLPVSLDSLVAPGRLQADDTVDPTTGERYGYRVLSDSTVELCATFARASDASETGLHEWSDIGAHDAGRHCFTVQPDRK